MGSVWIAAAGWRSGAGSGILRRRVEPEGGSLRIRRLACDRRRAGPSLLWSAAVSERPRAAFPWPPLGAAPSPIARLPLPLDSAVPLPLLAHLWLATASPAPAELLPGEVDAVELPWSRLQELREAVREDPIAAAPGPWVAEREIELRAVEGGLMLSGRWTIVAEQAGWVARELLGPGIELHSATLDGHVAPAVTLPGSTLLVAWIERGRPVELRVRAFIPTGLDDRIELGLLPATRGRLRVAVPGRVPVPVASSRASGAEAPPLLHDEVVWSGAPHLGLELRDPSSTQPARETLAVAYAGVGLTVGDAEVRGRAHVQWELRRGALERVRIDVAGLGDDLTVEGRDLSTWSRSGDALEVELKAPATGRVDLELRWTQAVPAGDEAQLPLPRIEPQAWRSESSLQLARDGELEVIPAIEEGTAIAAAALPTWGQGLVEGTPSAAYQRAGSSTRGHLDLLRFVPVPGPPSVIDVATYTIATTDEGRVLMKAHYDLRNDRGAHLTVRPPPGLRIIGARVGLDTALPSRDEDGAWRIPLRRSLETVDGLLSFPVEVILLGEQEPWQRRERRELPLPTLDAPIAAARATLYLPPRYRSRIEQGERNVVDEFAQGEGLTYGRGVGNDEATLADALFEQAVQGYLENDFEAAQAKLEEIQSLGVSNANMARLQSNIDVIEGKQEAKGKGDVTLQRRVKEQARARASEDFRQQEALIAEAESAAHAGDYAQAEAQYQAALELGGKLAKLEQAESVEQEARNAVVEDQLSTVSKKSKKVASKNAIKSPRFGSSFGSSSSSVSTGGDGGESFREIDEKTREEPAEAAKPRIAFRSVLDPSSNVPEPEPEPEPTPELDANELVDTADDEDVYRSVEPDDEPMIAARQRARFSRGRGRAGGGGNRGRTLNVRSRTPRGSAGNRAPAKSPDSATVYDFADDDLDGAVLTPEGAASIDLTRAAPARDAPLLPPKVTASALSVVIPATGQAVRYEQLLIEANQTQTIDIDARRRLRR